MSGGADQLANWMQHSQGYTIICSEKELDMIGNKK